MREALTRQSRLNLLDGRVGFNKSGSVCPTRTVRASQPTGSTGDRTHFITVGECPWEVTGGIHLLGRPLWRLPDESWKVTGGIHLLGRPRLAFASWRLPDELWRLPQFIPILLAFARRLQRMGVPDSNRHYMAFAIPNITDPKTSGGLVPSKEMREN